MASVNDRDRERTGEGIRTHAGLTYARHDGVELAGDLFLPAGTARHPVLLAVPGGGWRFGQRSGLHHWGEYLAQHGIAVFCIDYRQATAGPTFPQAACDVLAAAQFLCGEASSFQLDAARLGLLGSSAGAHLAALIALAGHAPPLSGAYPSDRHAAVQPRYRVLVGAYGIYDLFAHWQDSLSSHPESGDDFTERFIGGAPYDDPQRYVLASPLRHVAYRANALKVFLTWGTHDTAVSPRQSEAFQLALEQARFHVRTCPVIGAGHFWFSDEPLDDPGSFTAFVAPRIVRFLRRHL